MAQADRFCGCSTELTTKDTKDTKDRRFVDHPSAGHAAGSALRVGRLRLLHASQPESWGAFALSRGRSLTEDLLHQQQLPDAPGHAKGRYRGRPAFVLRWTQSLLSMMTVATCVPMIAQYRVLVKSTFG